MRDVTGDVSVTLSRDVVGRLARRELRLAEKPEISRQPHRLTCAINTRHLMAVHTTTGAYRRAHARMRATTRASVSVVIVLIENNDDVHTMRVSARVRPLRSAYRVNRALVRRGRVGR